MFVLAFPSDFSNVVLALVSFSVSENHSTRSHVTAVSLSDLILVLIVFIRQNEPLLL